MKLKISTDYTLCPGPRYIDEGDFSGEHFRVQCLAPKFKEALAKKANLEVDLDGTAGYGTSFLEEAFGGLIREDGFEFETIITNMKFVSGEQPHLISEINQYLNDAKEEAGRR